MGITDAPLLATKGRKHRNGRYAELFSLVKFAPGAMEQGGRRLCDRKLSSGQRTEHGIAD